MTTQRHLTGYNAEACHQCTERNNMLAWKIPCLQAHQLAVQHKRNVLVSARRENVGESCPLACTWEEVCDLVHEGRSHNIFTPNGESKILVEISNHIGDQVKYRRPGDLPIRDPRVGANSCGYSQQGGMWLYGTSTVLIRAWYPQDTAWHEFIPQYLQGCLSDLTGIGGPVKFGWALQYAMEAAPSVFKKHIKELLEPNNLKRAALVFALFAVANALPPTRAIAYILGTAATAADVAQAARQLASFSHQVNAAWNSEQLKKAGETFAEFLVTVMAIVGPMVIGAVAGRLFRWFLKREIDWREAERIKAKTPEAVAEQRLPRRTPGRGPCRLHVELPGMRLASGSQDTYLLAGEYKAYAEASMREVEVIRDPDAARRNWLWDRILATAKQEGTKSHSLKGNTLPAKLEPYRGLVAIKESEFVAGGIDKNSVAVFSPADMHYSFQGTDPVGIYCLKTGTVIRDWRPAATAEFLFAHIGEMDGERVFLVITKGLGTPVLADVDVLAIARIENGSITGLGSSSNYAAHIPRPLRQLRRLLGLPESTDDAAVGHQRNRQIEKSTNNAHPLYANWQHSEATGSAGFVDSQRIPLWNPNAQTREERLLMFILGQCYIFDNWYAYRNFCQENSLGFLCPWKF